jgi:hypothetical protein
MRNHDYWVYILTNKHCTTLYIGITITLPAVCTSIDTEK